MFFIASKIGWFLVQPMSIIAILIALGFLLILFRRPRLSATAIGIGLLIYLVCGYTSLGYVLIQPLDERFVRPALPPPKVDGIVMLGGGMDTRINNARHGYELSEAGDRFVEGLRLAQEYPTARLIFVGGFGSLTHGEETEAVAAERFFAAMGIDPRRLQVDDKSRNTDENAQFAKAIANPKPGETWLLVTSAFHMPRAVGLFRRQGFVVVPWPVDYHSTGSESFGLALDAPSGNMGMTDTAIREWIGLVAYWLSGRIDSPLPGP